MSVHIVIQPVAGYGAEVIEPSTGVRQLVAGSDQAGFTVQVPARIGGLADTARFARSLATAASEFADWCEAQNRDRSVDDEPAGWTRIDNRNRTDERE
jgi:hypothetical protein